MTLKQKILTLSLIPVMMVAAPVGTTHAATTSGVEIKRSTRSFKEYYAKRYAMCIGINQYKGLPNLNCAVSDAVEMAAVFEAYGFDEVVLLTDDDASRSSIMTELARLQAKAQDDDLFVFFFAGHGMTLRNGTDLSGVLVPADCGKGREAQDGISMNAIKKISEGMNNRHSLFLMDACYSGYGVAGATNTAKAVRKISDKALERMVSNRSVQILTAGGELDRAFESDGHGLFTRYLLECLKGNSDEARDGVISGNELAASVRAKVREETGGWQTPQFAATGSGDIVFTMGRTIASSAVAMAN